MRPRPTVKRENPRAEQPGHDRDSDLGKLVIFKSCGEYVFDILGVAGVDCLARPPADTVGFSKLFVGVEGLFQCWCGSLAEKLLVDEVYADEWVLDRGLSVGWVAAYGFCTSATASIVMSEEYAEEQKGKKESARQVHV